MRRKNREVTEKDDIFDILWRCDTVRIGMIGPDGPYVVPVSFGLDLSGSAPTLYFHCAREGLKVDMLAADGRVCVEGDIFLGYEVERHGITTRYESAIGFGKCEVVEDDECDGYAPDVAEKAQYDAVDGAAYASLDFGFGCGPFSAGGRSARSCSASAAARADAFRTLATSSMGTGRSSSSHLT